MLAIKMCSVKTATRGCFTSDVLQMPMLSVLTGILSFVKETTLNPALKLQAAEMALHRS